MQSIHSLTSNLVIVVLCMAVLIHASDKTDKEDDSSAIFKPTHEWQVLKKGQPIPKGLHVRINLETGITEAKLLDSEGGQAKGTAVAAVQKEILPDGMESLKTSSKDEVGYDTLRESMKNIHGDDNGALDTIESVKKFRTAGQLKKDLKDMNMQVKSDFELIRELMSKFATSTSNKEKISVLIDLEYLVHQFDNAREFVRLNGFTEIVHPSFNASDVKLRSEAIRLLGSAGQSNPQVQSSAMSSGSIQLLLRTLLHDKDLTVRSVALYALSCLVRNFPSAQEKMIAEGGLAVFAQVFDNRDNGKLRIKLVTLLNDLILESLSGDSNVTPPLDSKKLELESKLREGGWCHRLPALLTLETSQPEDDVVEKVIEAMSTLAQSCGQVYEEHGVGNLLAGLKAWYEEKSRSEPCEYYEDMAAKVTELANKLKKVKLRVEL